MTSVLSSGPRLYIRPEVAHCLQVVAPSRQIGQAWLRITHNYRTHYNHTPQFSRGPRLRRLVVIRFRGFPEFDSVADCGIDLQSPFIDYWKFCLSVQTAIGLYMGKKSKKVFIFFFLNQYKAGYGIHKSHINFFFHYLLLFFYICNLYFD